MTVPAALWPEVSRRFDELLGTAQEERSLALRRLEAERPDVASHVARLLAAHERTATDDPLAMPSQLLANAIAAHRPGHATPLQAGRVVGPYRLVEPLGEGGMASVWLADQTVSIQRRVALKIPHLGLEDAAAAASRFAQERDVLASLEHAHIARLYDAGVSADGLPYLAMEWIDGVSICRYADARRLGVGERVALFAQVLEAVRFAHARLVIHRDIKPSNILVTAEGQVKLLDFGIARLLERTAATEAGFGDARALTPECASPEQLAGGALETTSDVYSLGVVLYELLCGARPYRLEPAAAFDAGAWHAALMRTVVRPPSRGVIDDAIASARRATPRELQRRLAGDLDAIVLRAMQKSSAARYPSAESLGADLDRWLRGWPVLARPATWRYVAGLFVRRHRAAFGAGCLVAVTLAIGFGLEAATVITLLLVLGLGAALWFARRARHEARRARQEARRAQAVQDFLVSLFTANDPEHARGRELSARALLDRGSKRLETELQDEPAVLARLHQEIGGIYIQLGSNVSARPHLERALALYRAMDREGSEPAIDTLYMLIEAFEEEMDFDTARPLIARCLDLAARNFGPRHRWKLPLLKELGWIDVHEGRPEEAAVAIAAALADVEQGGHASTVEIVKARNVLGSALIDLGRFVEAREQLSRAIRERAELPDYEITSAMAERYNLARVRFNLREFEAVEKELAALVPEMDSHVGGHHDRAIKARSLWAQTMAELGRYDDAIEAQRINLAAALARESIDEEVASLQKLTLAKLYKMAVRPAEGLPLLREGLAFYDGKRGEPNVLGEVGRRLLGELLLQEGRLDEALATFALAAERGDRAQGCVGTVVHADLLQAWAMALQIRAGSGDVARAVDLLARAHAICAASLGEDNAGTLRCAALLAWLHTFENDAAGAVDTGFGDAADRYCAVLPPRHVARAELQWMRATLRRRRGADDADSLEAAGRDEWERAMGRRFEPPLTMLH